MEPSPADAVDFCRVGTMHDGRPRSRGKRAISSRRRRSRRPAVNVEDDMTTRRSNFSAHYDSSHLPTPTSKNRWRDDFRHRRRPPLRRQLPGHTRILYSRFHRAVNTIIAAWSNGRHARAAAAANNKAHGHFSSRHQVSFIISSICRWASTAFASAASFPPSTRSRRCTGIFRDYWPLSPYRAA